MLWSLMSVFRSAILPGSSQLLRYDWIVLIEVVLLIALSINICLEVLKGSWVEVWQSIRVSLSVNFFGRPDLFLSMTDPVSWNFKQTLLIVVRPIFRALAILLLDIASYLHGLAFFNVTRNQQDKIYWNQIYLKQTKTESVQFINKIICLLKLINFYLRI